MEIPDTGRLVKKKNRYQCKIKSKIPSISGLATNAALPGVENKIPDVSSLVKKKKKTDYNTKFTQIERKVTDHIYDKYVTTPEFKMFTAKVFHSRLKQVNLTTKTDFDNKLINLNIKKINLNKTKHLLVENELKKLQTFDSIYFRGKCHFEEDATQKYLVFQPMRKCFKTISNTDYVLEWKTKGFSDESIKSLSSPNIFLDHLFDYLGDKIKVKFSGSCLK